MLSHCDGLEKIICFDSVHLFIPGSKLNAATGGPSDEMTMRVSSFSGESLFLSQFFREFCRLNPRSQSEFELEVSVL